MSTKTKANGLICSMMAAGLLASAMPSFAGEAPDGLSIEFLRGPGVVKVVDAAPVFGWVLHSDKPDNVQVAYRILVSRDAQTLARNEGDVWDSGKVESSESVNVAYAGKPLVGRQSYSWKVKTWLRHGGEQPWSEPQPFVMGELSNGSGISRYEQDIVRIAPASIRKLGDGHYLVDFGKDAYSYLKLDIEAPAAGGTLGIRLGERADENGVNREPGGSITHKFLEHALTHRVNSLDVFMRKGVKAAASHKAGDILAAVGPFRYAELTGCPVELTPAMIGQMAIFYRFDDKAASFESSDRVLNDVWELCKYSMKATSFMGVYIDGDRERLPYEADAYINQLSHYAVDCEYTLARITNEGFMRRPTWPTEWKQHTVLIAWAEYMYTGNRKFLEKHYDALKRDKIYMDRARPDGLLDTKGLRDIVDWPAGERDGYDFKPVNTVVNAFNYKVLLQMAEMASVLGKKEDAAAFRAKAAAARTAFNKVLFDENRGIYIDGEGSQHASLHANMMPLAFGLVPPERVKTVADFVVSRGMACSVYGAQYLLEGLYEAGRPDAALERMTAKDMRSWFHMLELGSTVTLEAWDNRYKRNQDWNHAWGAAPGNIIARYVLGVQPLEPGFAKALIRPCPADLVRVRGAVPTIRGPVQVAVENEKGGPFKVSVDVPVNMTARIAVPRRDHSTTTVTLDGGQKDAQVEGDFLFLDGVGSGPHVVTAR